MPAALPGIDWNHAKLLRFQGLTFQEIADQLGVSRGLVSMRASRGKWSVAATKARQAVTDGVTSVVTKRLAERAESWTEQLASNVEQSIAGLAKLKQPKSLRKWKEYEETLLTHTKRGRSTFGLDQQSARTTVNVGIQAGVAAVRVEDNEKPNNTGE